MKKRGQKKSGLKSQSLQKKCFRASREQSTAQTRNYTRRVVPEKNKMKKKKEKENENEKQKEKEKPSKINKKNIN
jgi:hypothetical protein